MDTPLISVITPVYNRAAVVDEAIASVQAQRYPAYEHIVVDGGSTDGTLKVLSRYPHLRVVSRPDKGMYHALNDGLAMAQGEIITFLNSDDLYRPHSFHAAVVHLQKHPEADAVAGQAEYFLEQEERAPWIFRRTRPLTPGSLWKTLTYGDPAFNAWFFRRRAFERLGGLDPAYRIAGDREFLLRFALAGLQVQALPQVVYAYRVHADSLSLSTQATRFIAVAEEWLTLGEQYLPRLPAEGQRWLRRAMVRDTITASSRSLRHGRWQQAAHYARRGWQITPWWPLLFTWRLAGGIFRITGRRLRLYPPV